MKKKIKYKNSSLDYETGLSSTITRDDNTVDWEAFTFITNIKIDKKDDVRVVFAKLLGQAVKEILQMGEIYVRLFLHIKNIDQFLLDDYKLVILSLGFEQVSVTTDGIMFVFGSD